MTTTIRDLTTAEAQKLGFLRARFSDRPDIDAIVDEAKQDMLALPVPPACPDWCGSIAGHIYEMDGGADYLAARFHELATDEYVFVSQEERYRPDGTVTLGEPYVLVGVDQQLDAATTDRVASATTAAAKLLREIAATR